MACLGRNLVQEAARLLNDAEPGFEHIRWTAADLLAYLNDALCVLFLARPDDFIETAEITLSQGSRQTLPDGVKLIYRIDGTLDANGAMIGEQPSKTNDRVARWFAARRCSAGVVAGASGSGVYFVSDYTIDGRDASTFIVNPPVPPGENPVILARVVRSPAPMKSGADDLPVDCCLAPALLEWMLYRAYSVDDESVSSPTRAHEHVAMFFQLLRIDEEAQRDLLSNRSSLSSTIAVPATGAAG